MLSCVKLHAFGVLKLTKLICFPLTFQVEDCRRSRCSLQPFLMPFQIGPATLAVRKQDRRSRAPF